VQITDLGPANTRLCSLVTSVADTDLDRPTPCTEYTVGDLLDHIAGVTIAFGGAAVKAGGAAADMGPAGDAAHLAPDWRTSIPLHLTALVGAWRNPGAWSGMTRVGGQDMPAEAVGVVTLGELVVHGWDLARATGQAFDPDPDTLVPLYDLTVKTFGSGDDAARGPAFAPAVPVPGDAPMMDQILGLLGRDPVWKAPA
jgi:uncharacterized protein (TIGR03086 family)